MRGTFMDTKDYENKFCEECRFFKQHYAIVNTEFYKTSYGHCSNDILSRDKKKFIGYHNTACKHWQPVSCVITERREKLKDTLYCVSERLKEISIIMEHDKNFD